MTTPKLNGVWSHPSETSPGCEEVMCIDEERGRIITFVFTPPAPKPLPIRNWFRPLSSAAVELRLRMEAPWRVHEFRFEEESLVWFYGGRAHHWKRLAASAHPEWLGERLVAANAKMDQEEQRGDIL